MAANPSQLRRPPGKVPPTARAAVGEPVEPEVVRVDERAGRPAGRRARRQRFEARKVRRLIRHIDPWSVLKLSLVFFFCMWLIGLIASVIVWQVAVNSGTISKVESFFSNLGLPDTKINGEFFLRQFGLIGLILVTALSVATTVTSVVFNLISDLIGGIWITVIEEETGRPIAGSPVPQDDV